MSGKTRLWALVTGLIGAIVILYGVLAGFLPQLQTASLIRSESETTEFLIETQEAQLLRLQQADGKSAELEAQLKELEVSIPTDPDWAEFLRELQRIQDSTGAIASTIQVEVGELPSPVVEEVASGYTEVVVDQVGDGTSATPEETPAEMSTGLIRIPVIFSPTGTESQVAEFIRQLQVGERLFLATSVDIDVQGEAGATATVVGSIYVTP